MHVGEVELLLALGLIDFIVFLAEEVAAQLPVAPFAELLGSHQHGRAQIASAHLRANQVAAQCVVILHLLLDVGRHAEVGGRTVQVFLGHRLRALNLPTRMKQRVGNLLVLNVYNRLGHNAVALLPCPVSIISPLSSLLSLLIIILLRNGGPLLPVPSGIILKPGCSCPGKHIHAHQYNHHRYQLQSSHNN